MTEPLIQLGDRVRDKVSGIEGIAAGRTLWLNGCERWTLSPNAGEDGKLSDDICVDVQQLELVESDPLGFRLNEGEAADPTGGPTSSTPRPY